MARRLPSISIVPKQLRPRLVATVASVLAVSVFSLAWFQANQVAELSFHWLRENGLSTARTLADAIASDSQGHDRLILKHDLHTLLDSASIHAIAVTDRVGNTLAQATVANASDHTHHVSPIAGPSSQRIVMHRQPAVSFTSRLYGGKIAELEIRQPIDDATLRGWVVVHVDLTESEIARQWAFINTLESGLVILGACVLVVVLLIRRPLRELEQATAFVSALDRNAGKTFPQVRSTAELELLSNAINWASTRLHEQSHALQSSEARNRSLLESLKEVVFKTDAQGRWTYLNPAWQEITGFDVQGSLGRPCRQFIHPEDRVGGSELYRWLVDNGQNRGQRQVRHVTRAGNVRWLEVHCRPERDEGGAVTGVSGTLIDVTDRRIAERKLHDQLQLTQQLLDAVPAPIFYRTSDGRFLGVNSAYSELFGFAPEHYLGKTAQEAMPPEFCESHVLADAQVLGTETGIRYDADIVAIGGDVRNTVCTKAPFYTADGTVAGTIGFFADITAQRRAKRQIAESKAFLDRLIDTLPGALFVKDRAHRFVLVNDAWLRLNGRSRGEVIGQTDYDLFSADEARVSCQKDDAAFAGASAIEDERTIVSAQGVAHSVLTRVRAFESAPDHHFVVGISSDITEVTRAKARAEDQLRFTSELVDALPFPLYVTNLDGAYIIMNRATEHLLGIQRDTLIGKTAADLQPAEVVELHNTMDEAVLAGKRAISYATRTYTAEGKYRETIITKGVFTDAIGEVAGIIGTIHDITDRRRIEKRLNVQYEIARILAASRSVQDAAGRIMEAIGTAMGYSLGTLWEVDPSTETLQHLELWCASDDDRPGLTKLAKSLRFVKGPGLLGAAWNLGAPARETEILPDRLLSQLRSGLALPIKSGSQVVAVMHFFGSGRTSDTDADLIAMLEAAGNQIALFIERQRAELTLRASEAAARKLSLVARHTHNAVIVTDTGGRMEWVNQAFSGVTGYSSEEALGRKPGELLQGPDSDQTVIAYMREKILAQEGFSVELVNYRKNGEKYWVNVEVEPVTSDAGDLINFIAIVSDITERKLGEAALIEATTRLNLAIEGSNLALWDWPIQTGRVYCSEVFSVILGREKREGIFSIYELRELIHPEDLRAARNALIGNIRGRSDACRVLFRVRDTHGDWHWCQCHGKVVEQDANGRAIRMAGIVADVTEHHKAEAGLRISEERYDLAVNATNDGIWDLNLIDNTGYISPRYAELLDLRFYPGSDVLLRWRARVHPADRGNLDRILRAHLETDAAYDVECRMAIGENQFRWFRVRGKAQRDAKGQPVRIVGSISDTTDYRLAQEQLHETRDRLESILRSTEHMIWSRSIDSRKLLYINPAVRKIYGREPEEFEANPALSLEALHHEDRARVLAASARLLENRSMNIDFRIRRPDSSIAWVNERTRVACNAAGRPIRIDAITTDISMLKLRETELREAKDAAEAATHAKSEFLANMSHEIRTPMNGIIGMTDLVLTTDLSEEQRDYLEVVRSSSDTLLEVINDILDFSKIEAGKLTFEVTEFLLRDTLADTIKLLAMRAEEKGLELMWRVNSDVPDLLLGDPMRLRQVVTNLLSNAIKFTFKGEVELCVGVSEPAATTVKLLFAVRDTGTGISYDKTTSIFHAFSQGDMSITRKYGGTGLGLTICERLVSMMGGNISLKSSPGEGSTFYFSAAFGIGGETSAQPIAGELDLGGLNVLVSDDNAAQLVCLVETLGAWQMRCTAEPDLDRALAFMERAIDEGMAFDLAIVDSQMLGADETKLVRAIRARPRLKNLPLLLLTPIRSRRKRTQTRRRCTYLTKACSNTELKHAIATALGRCVPGDAFAGQEPPLLSSRGRELRVLLVEDNEINVRFARGVLQKLGHTVSVARNGMEALQAISAGSAEPFDLVLMDVQMPVMSGLEATGAIRVLEGGTGRRLPIIAMTANAMRGDRERCIEAGMDDYLSKPVEVSTLVGVIERTLGRQQGTSDSSTPVHEEERPLTPTPKRRRKGAATSVFDRDTILETLNDDHIAFKELSEMLLADHKPMLEAAGEALVAGNADELASIAHTLKGMVGNFAARDASKAAEAFYAAAHAGRMKKAAAALRSFEQKMAELEQALRADPILAEG